MSLWRERAFRPYVTIYVENAALNQPQGLL
jgi:hypothetical protein